MLLLLRAGLVHIKCFLLEGGGMRAYLRVGAYKLFGLSGWALIQGGRLFEGGGLIK